MSLFLTFSPAPYGRNCNIADWANHHNLKLSQTKRLEIIITCSLQTPPTSAATFLTGVDSLTVLGVTFNSKLHFDLHVSNIIYKAARALYMVRRPSELRIYRRIYTIVSSLHGFALTTTMTPACGPYIRLCATSMNGAYRPIPDLSCSNDIS